MTHHYFFAEVVGKAKTHTDFQKDNMTFGQKIGIKLTSTGHFCIELHNKLCDQNKFKSKISFFWNNSIWFDFFRKI